MAKLARSAKRARGSGRLVIITVLLALAGLGTGGHWWNRAAAVSAARRFMAVLADASVTGQPDFARLKALVVREEARELEKVVGAVGSGSPPSSAPGLGSAKLEYRVRKVSAGLREATVEVAVKVGSGPASQLLDGKVVLLREGLAWKVSSKRTGQASGGRG